MKRTSDLAIGTQKGTKGLPTLVLPLVALAIFVGSVARYSTHYQGGHRLESKPPSPLMPTENDRLAGMRIAGWHNDRSQIPILLECLKNGHPSYAATAIQALEELDASEALPAFDVVIQNYPDIYIREQARAAHARVKADLAVEKLQGNSYKAQTRIDRFLAEEGFDTETINQGVLAYHSTSVAGEYPQHLHAMREIADIVYRDPASDYQHLPQLSGMNYSLDAGAALKIQLAQMPKQARLPWMINTLASKTTLKPEDGMLIQLAIDEGLPASHAASKMLGQMDLHRDQYQYMGFCALFRVLDGIGDKDQAFVVSHFLSDKDGNIAYYANQVYRDVKQGLRCQYAVGY